MRPFRAEVIEQLRQQMTRLEDVAARDQEGISTGIAALDALLPQRGWRPGDLIEWLSEGPGSGASTLALASAAPFLERGGALVVVDEAAAFYPPVLSGLGIALASVIIVRPKKAADTWWALEQALRCPGVAVTFGQVKDSQVSPRSSLATRSALFRRLQLAAETGGGIGILLRSASVRTQPTWAHLRLLVRPVPSPSSQSTRRHVQVELLYARGALSGGVVDLELTDDEGSLRAARRFAPSRRPGDSAANTRVS